MGWCSATEIFDTVVGALIEDEPDKVTTVKHLINVLEDGDWDCQQDSAFFHHPVVVKCFRELHPDWFDEDEI